MALWLTGAAVYNGAAGLLLFIDAPDAPSLSRPVQKAGHGLHGPSAAEKKSIRPSSLDPLCSNPF